MQYYRENVVSGVFCEEYDHRTSVFTMSCYEVQVMKRRSYNSTSFEELSLMTSTTLY